MPIPIQCSCSAKLKVGDHLQGKHIKCPKCGSIIPVSQPASQPPPASPPEPTIPDQDAILKESRLSAEERERLEEELAHSEQLLWAGKPDPKWSFIYGWGISIFLFILGGMLGGVMLFSGREGFARDTVGLVINIALLTGAGGCLVAGLIWPFIRREYARRTVYAVTTARALAWVPNYFGKIFLVVYQPEDMGKLYRRNVTQGEDGVGNLIFGTFVRKKKVGRDAVRLSYHSYGFALVRGAARVEKIIREALVDKYLDQLYE
jgi:hypothetical protein